MVQKTHRLFIISHEEPRLLQESPEDEGFLAILQARRPQACGGAGGDGWLDEFIEK